MRLAFGKYAGAGIETVPAGYLFWLQQNVRLSRAMEKAIVDQLKRRNFYEAGDDTMPFGRYAGYKLEELPLSYLSWSVQHMSALTEPTRQRMRIILQEAEYYRGPAATDKDENHDLQMEG